MLFTQNLRNFAWWYLTSIKLYRFIISSVTLTHTLWMIQESLIKNENSVNELALFSHFECESEHLLFLLESVKAYRILLSSIVCYKGILFLGRRISDCLYFTPSESDHTIWFVYVHCRYTKPKTFADCVGDELPLGWEEVIDPSLGVYYIDHINRKYAFACLFV